MFTCSEDRDLYYVYNTQMHIYTQTLFTFDPYK